MGKPELVTNARRPSAWLRLGQVLELMQRKACCFELGFSSLAAYALERCERGARWVEVACCLARRLEVLPLLRSALATGRIVEQGGAVGALACPNRSSSVASCDGAKSAASARGRAAADGA
jgi:hypothetical protein